MKQKQNQHANLKIILIALLLLSLISLLTRYHGTSDIGDYSDTAKFFSNNYKAKLRVSHPVTYGLLHAPFLTYWRSFLPFKITNLLWIFLLILSIYYISDKNNKTLLLFVTTPALWFMAPWITPVVLASLLFLWVYYFINKYDKNEKLKYLAYSGLLIGAIWIIWEAIIYFAVVLAMVFLYNKKTSHALFFILMVFIGVIPKLLIDYVLFGFPFYSILKHFLSVIAFSFYGSIYGEREARAFLHFFPYIFIIPIYTLILLTKENLKRYKREIIFIFFALFMTWVAGTQIRYIFITIPIIILLLGKILTQRQFIIQLIIFLILTLLVVNPYIIQMKYETNAYEYPLIITKLGNLKISSQFTEDLIKQDLDKMSIDYPNQTFVVGNGADIYQVLADIYWGNNIKEFVSIQDYNLHLKNDTTIFEKRICSSSLEWNRRDICVSASLEKPFSDNTDYNSIKYALSTEENLNLENFKLIKKYQKISLFEKT